MNEVSRVSARQTREARQAGRAELVCAYGDANKCADILLEGAESWPDFRGRLKDMDTEREIILYCA